MSARRCAVCDRDISDRKPNAKTCSDAHRKELSRRAQSVTGELARADKPAYLVPRESDQRTTVAIPAPTLVDFEGFILQTQPPVGRAGYLAHLARQVVPALRDGLVRGLVVEMMLELEAQNTREQNRIARREELHLEQHNRRTA